MPRQPKPNPIDMYLASVRTFIQVLPADDIDDMLAEIREHLSTSTAELIGLGWDPAVASKEAIRRFGPAPRIGKRLIEKYPYAWAWKRDKYGLATAPSLPTWPIALGVLIWAFSGPIRFDISPAFLAMGFTVGFLNDVAQIVKDGYQSNVDGIVRQSITQAKSAPDGFFQNVARRTGVARFILSLRLTVKRKSPSRWSQDALRSGAIALCMVYWYLRSHNPAAPLYVYVYLASAVGAAISRLSITTYARRSTD